MSIDYNGETNDSTINSIVEAINNIPEKDVPDGFRDELMRAIRVEALLSGNTEKRTDSFNKVSHLTKKFNRKYIFISATAACIVLVLMFAFINSGVAPKHAGDSAQFAEYPQSAPAPAAAPMAPAGETFAEGADTGSNELNLYDGMDSMLAEEAVSTDAETEYDREASESGPNIQSTAGSGVKETNSKLIKTSYYNMEVVSFDKTVSEIQGVIEAAGGYVESFDSSIYNEYYGVNGRRDLKAGNICLKVPQSEYSSAKIRIGDLGKITFMSENIDNITSKYVDAAARLEVKKAEEQRLLELFGIAQEIEDLISLESRLTYVRSDIESMTAQLKSWDNSVAFSTINISITEVIDFSQTQAIDPTLGEKIKEGFNRSASNFTYTLERLAVKAAENSIALLILIIGAAVVIISVRIAWKRGMGGKSE